MVGRGRGGGRVFCGFWGGGVVVARRDLDGVLGTPRSWIDFAGWLSRELVNWKSEHNGRIPR